MKINSNYKTSINILGMKLLEMYFMIIPKDSLIFPEAQFFVNFVGTYYQRINIPNEL